MPEIGSVPLLDSPDRDVVRAFIVAELSINDRLTVSGVAWGELMATLAGVISARCCKMSET